MRKFLLFMVLFFVSFSLFAKTITAEQDPWPPFIDPGRASQGLSIEIIRQAFATQGYEFKLKIVPWARAINDVKDGTVDVLPSTWFTQKRTKFLEYSHPYLANTVKFFKRKGDKFKYSGLSSLNGLSVGVVRGYGYSDAFLNSSKFSRPATASLLINIRKLIAGRIDLTLGDALVARSMMEEKDPSLLSKIEFTKNALIVKKIYVTSGLANPRHKAIIAIFNKGLAEVKQNGTFNKILKSYGMKSEIDK